MSSSAGVSRTTLVDLVVAAVREGRCSPAGALAALARRVDRERSRVPEHPALVLPLLDTLAAGAPEPTLAAAPPRDDRLAAASLDGAGPELLGHVHEALLDVGHRRTRGVFYTPGDVAIGLVVAVVDRLDADVVAGRAAPVADAPPTICDPALGGGVFLLAAADALRARGLDPSVIVERCLWGIDVDPLAVAVTQAALILWSRSHGVATTTTNVVCADTLLDGPDSWPEPPPDGFTVVIGNPPFQNQLGSGTARSVADAARLRERWGPAVFRYTDTAALFLLAATRLVAPGGRVALIVPVSVLVTDDADKVRRDLLDHGDLEHLWVANDAVFAAGVRVCAPVLRRSSAPDRPAAVGPVASPPAVSRSTGRTFEALAPTVIDRAQLRELSTWAVLLADASGVPSLTAAPGAPGRLGDFCTATAGFRDQYYGLRPFVVEGGAGATPVHETVGADRWARLVTSGLIDPARCLWGTRRTRFDGRSWLFPIIDVARLGREDPALAAWAAARLVPKVVVATQTRVLEAAVDVDGDWFPSVPTIALTADPSRLWDAAAVVLAPPTTVWAMNRHIGAALSADALKVSASQLLDAPLPTDREAWSRGAEHLRSVSAAPDAEAWRDGLERFGREMTLAYAAPDEVLSWWLGRLPRWR